MFEGEYLNGKKWKGTEKIYDKDTGNFIFQCEYLNGIIDGEAKEYDKFTGDLLFEGKYLNGKRNGKGIKYKFVPIGKTESHLSCNKIIFIGEYIDGTKVRGKEYNYNGNLIYEGEYTNDKRNGKGKLYNNGRLIYEGDLITVLDVF